MLFLIDLVFRAAAVVALVIVCSYAQTCDDDNSFQSDSDPIVARESFQTANQKFPIQPVGRCGGEVNGFPTSLSRPGLWERYMFGVGADGVPMKNFNTNDLPVVETYFDNEGRPVDVFETITTATSTVDLFATDVLAVDSCRPNNYQASSGFFLYGSASIPHFAPGPTVKTCQGRMSTVRYENRATTTTTKPISVHLHGAASVAAYDGWAEDTTAVGYAKNYFFPNNRAA